MPPVELERRVREYLKRRPPVDRRVWDPRVDTGGTMLTPWDAGGIEDLLARAEREMSVHRALAEPVPPVPPLHPGPSPAPGAPGTGERRERPR
jgi:hypothetical protein